MSTGSIPAATRSYDHMNMEQLRQAEESAGKAYERSPKDKSVGMNYASVLMMTGKNTQALAVMQQIAIANPADRDVLAARRPPPASWSRRFRPSSGHRRRTGPTGGFIPPRAPCSISWDARTRHVPATGRRLT
jgi:hypothetical protein